MAPTPGPSLDLQINYDAFLENVLKTNIKKKAKKLLREPKRRAIEVRLPPNSCEQKEDEEKTQQNIEKMSKNIEKYSKKASKS